ncbi:Ferric cupric reductase transmembrane component 1 [Lecanosticta acicola]|uniref:Ferric cupric reductase transmembrane component 1 n=1 Tax=Lecanosticta acicola TaxID=111012 RepID=A0AAI8Z001_9PEZI|nr:Ferric cupric reductase transmembrane component 1 [Lecanosticta acicola]
MDDMSMGTPWLDQPVMLHSSRAYKCSLKSPAQCLYQQGYWRFWYEADHRYALPTVAFFLTAIILFAIPFVLNTIWPGTTSKNRATRKLTALGRFLSYRQYRIGKLNWNSAPLGVLLLGAVGTIFFFSMTLGPKPYYWPTNAKFGNSPPIATRAGWMSLGCLPFVIATSSKSNLITGFTGVSHERLQVFHRWISYAMFVLALIHTFPFIIFHIWKGDMTTQWNTSVAYWTGVVAIIAQAYLTFASLSPLRNMCYEWFKFSHFLAALVFVLFFFFHCDFRLSSWDYFVATGVLFGLTWLHSQLRIYFQHGIGKKATISLVSNGFIRVGIPTKTTWRAGQHFFVRFVGLGTHALTSHPFTACSLPTKANFYEAQDSELVFFIRPQGGLTARLAKYAEKHPGGKMRAMLDGPYGGIDMPKLATYERLLVLAGGSGAGWCLPLVEAFLRRKDCVECCNAPTGGEKVDCNIPSMKVVLATRDLATRNWFQEAISELLTDSLVGKCPPGLVVEVHYTGSSENAENPKRTGQFLHKLDEPEKAPDADVISHSGETSSDSESETAKGVPSGSGLSLRDFSCRPNMQALVAEECSSAEACRSMGVFVCGPGSMQSDVANAVAKEQMAAMKDGQRDVYLHMEHFSWA